MVNQFVKSFAELPDDSSSTLPFGGARCRSASLEFQGNTQANGRRFQPLTSEPMRPELRPSASATGVA